MTKPGPRAITIPRRIFLVFGLLFGQWVAPAPAADFALDIKQITAGPKHHFFGYIGHARTIPWNQTGRCIVALRTDFQDHMPRPDESADVVLLDAQKNFEARVVDRTRAWNFQQGTMFYWDPEAPETRFFFNDRDPKTQEVFVVLFDISKGANGERVAEFRFKDTPIGNCGVAQGGGWFLGINYGRLARLRSVTGYPGAHDWTVGRRSHPKDDGIFKVSMKTKEKRLLVPSSNWRTRFGQGIPMWTRRSYSSTTPSGVGMIAAFSFSSAATLAKEAASTWTCRSP